MRSSSWIGSTLVVLLAALGASTLAGCNDAQPTVNRVQPNVVEKKTFDGEWYFLQTVIDTPYSAGFTFVGEQGSLEKVKWEVQEEFLIARRSYEHIAGSEANGIADDSEANAPIAVYRISSHFDIRRDYNSVTGEEFNVIGENTTDRPWYQREYMRVDWSQNLANAVDIFAIARLIDGIEAEPVSYFVQDIQDENHPHRPKFEATRGGKEVTYIDLVNKMYVKPQSVEIEGYGKVPSCYLMGQDHLDCAAAEVTIRNSFLKVDPKHDYQPQEYTGDRMQRFGYFVTERAGYSAEYGVVEAARYRFANRHNLWVDSHLRADDGSYYDCTSDEHCGGGSSRCDLDYGKAHRLSVTAELQAALSENYPESDGFPKVTAGTVAGICTLPFRERQTQPIAYHVSPNFPAELLPDAQHLVDEWNEAFVGTVGSLREQECLAAGDDAGTCAAERDREDHQAMFVLCHNPVLDTDNAACGGEGTSAQIGDLRHSLIGWVNEPHLSSPLGYGPSAADPETGEIVMANAFVYGAGVETLSAFARDIIALLNGDLDAATVTSGSYITDWVKNIKAPGSELTGRPMDDHAVKVDGSNVERINEAMDFSWAASRGLRKNGPIAPAKGIKEALERFKLSEKTLYANGAFGNGSGSGVAKLSSLAGTDIEKMLTGPEMMIAAGVYPDTTKPIDDAVLEKASPLRGMDLGARRALARMRDKLQAEACILSADFADDGLLGLAKAIQKAATEGDGTMEWYGQSYKVVDDEGKLDYEAVRHTILHPIFDAVTAHEVGHTLGLRHNFSGSYDAWNYLPEYWQLRDDGNMKPRFLDAMTQTEVDGRIREFQYSTVMDYGNNFVVTDANGIGHYDHAAIKMGYGDLIEVFDGLTPQQAQKVAGLAITNALGWPIPLNLLSNSLEAYSYTDYPALVGGKEGLERRADARYEDVDPYAPLVQYGIDDKLFDKQGRPTVPYLFCSDEQADLNPDCFRYDSGADTYESLQSVMDNYYNYYLFNAFARGRVGYTLEGYFDRVANRFFGKLSSANQVYSLFRPIFGDVFGVAENDPFWTRPDGFGAWTAGVGASYQLLTQVVSTPEPGDYSLVTRPDGSPGYSQGSGGLGADLTVDEFQGRALESTWDFDLGYFWFDQIDHAGFFYDKVAAIMSLVDPRTNFLGRDTSADVRKYSLSYYTSFAPSMTSFLRAVQGADWGTAAPRAKDTGDLAFPDALSLVERDTPGTPIDPNMSFSIQLYAAVYGLALIPETYDERFTNSSRIFVKGSPNGVDLAPGTDTVTFVDSETGLQYVAASDVQGGKETGVAAQMINHANALKLRNETSTLRQFVGNLDLAHRLGWYYTFGN